MSKSIHVCQSYSKPEVGRFLDMMYMQQPYPFRPLSATDVLQWHIRFTP